MTIPRPPRRSSSRTSRVINEARRPTGCAAEGYDVDQACDGPGAVAAAPRRASPTLVVLDVMLPGFDGLEVCRRIQAERPVPVLMLTARDDEADILVGLAVGADDYLTKPFWMRELVARVARPAAPGRPGRRAGRPTGRPSLDGRRPASSTPAPAGSRWPARRCT